MPRRRNTARNHLESTDARSRRAGHRQPAQNGRELILQLTNALRVQPRTTLHVAEHAAEITPKDLCPGSVVDPQVIENCHLCVVDRLLPAAREE